MASPTITRIAPTTRYANLDLELYNENMVLVTSAYGVSRPATVSYPNAFSDRTYTYKVISRNHQVAYTFNPTYRIVELASVTARVKQGSTVLGTTTESDGNMDVDGLLPSSGTYTLELQNNSSILTVPSFTATTLKPTTRFSNLDLELLDPAGAKVAEAKTTGRPETLSLPNAPAGSYTLKVISADYDAAYTGSTSYTAAGHANLTFNLKNSAGTTVATATSATGSASFSHLTASGGSYTLETRNTAADPFTVPSFTNTWTATGTLKLELKNSTGSVVAQNVAEQNPKAASASVAPGTYTAVATPQGGSGQATMTVTAPGRPLKEEIRYDANDHAISIDDGNERIEETLSPSGRVIKRVVKDSVTSAVKSDTIYGYDGASDSPSYMRPTAGGTVTTYVSGPGGLLLTDIGGTATYPVTNGHGDIVGTTDVNGVFTANPVADEFGVGETPSSRLGYLGSHERFFVGGALRLMRMGVRLYDPALGRFLSMDPVEGGSANDYDYVGGDPINAFDLSGTCNEATVACVMGILIGTEELPVGFMEWAAKGRKGKRYTVRWRRTAAGSRAMKAHGTCSSPIGGMIPGGFDFRTACKTHDLGYDLMRFFKSTGPQGAIIHAVDQLFYLDMLVSCARRRVGPLGCVIVAEKYYQAVSLRTGLSGNRTP